MSDFALDPEPAHGREDFARRIGAVLERGWPLRVVLAPGTAERPEGWECQPDARLVVVLRGSQLYRWRAGSRTDSALLRPGEALWLAPGAPMRAVWASPVDFLGVVLRPRFLRFLVGRGPGGGRRPSPWSHHAPLPLGEPGTLVARALDALAAGRGDPAAAPELMRVLLRLAVAHAAACAEAAPGRGEATWRRVEELVAARCHGPLGRGEAAQALGLAPTYLSDLCRRRCGSGFAGLVAAVRIGRAQRILREEPDASVGEVAARVGFASAGWFVRSFRRATGDTPGHWRRTGDPGVTRRNFR